MFINSLIANGNSDLEKVLRQLAAGTSLPVTTGNVYFVVPSSNANYVPFSSANDQIYTDSSHMVQTSLTNALAACVADRGDLIVVAPGYTETITGAAGQTITKAGVTVMGLGNGRARPTFTFTTAVGASFDITAANVTISNCVFICGIDAQTAMFNVTGADFAFLGNEIVTNTATIGAILGILTAATASRLRVENNFFTGAATNSGTTTTAQIDHEVGVDYVIKNNYFQGKMTQAITNGAAILRGLIDGNRFVVATGTKAINMHASSTPFITNNRINVASGVAPIVAAAGFVAGNSYSAAAGVAAGTAITI